MAIETNNDQQAEQKVSPQAAFVQAAEEEFRERRCKNGRGPQPDPEWVKLSREEREEWEETRRMNADAMAPFNTFLSNIIRDCTRWPWLLCVPKMMTNDYLLGTNIAMRVIIPGNHSEYRYHAIKALHESYRNASGPSAMEYIRWVRDRSADSPRNLAECFWLLKLAQHLECALPEFEKTIDDALRIWESPEELEFIEPFDLSSPRGKLLQLRSGLQYEALEALLRQL